MVDSLPITLLTEQQFTAWKAEQPALVQQWITANDFKAKSDTLCLIPNAKGELQAIVFGYAAGDECWAIAGLANRLPPGQYHFDNPSALPLPLELLALAWGLGSYQFSRYKTQTKSAAQLVGLDTIDQRLVQEWITSINLARDLINTPTEDMGPLQLAQAVEQVAAEFGAQVATIVGDELLTQNYPTVHAVGRAAARPPRLIDMRWGDAKAPKVTLVGKGVCFDSGGLNLKPGASMLTMKKDMAGSAHVLALARMIMALQLPVRLRVLIPAVENAVSGSSYRPGDIIKTRSGKTVEITNTDAEGRLVLCDALTEAVSEKPEYIIDFASLTGAASVALGPYLPAFFCNNDEFAAGIVQASVAVQDPLWRMPLYAPYRKYLLSPIADLVNATSVAAAGAITAALYLQAFVPDDICWAHFDLTAWNDKGVTGRPYGGEALALRAVFQYLQTRWG